MHIFWKTFIYNYKFTMKLTKNELKTWNSQQSDIDLFSKLQNNFLEKFFRLNLIDYFDDMLINIPQIQPLKKINNKNTKSLLNHLFRVQKQFMVNEFEQKIHTFYKNKSKSFESGQLQHAFKIRYCNWNPVPNYFRKGQLIQFQVKIKAEIQKLQNIPQKMIDLVQTHTRNDRNNQDYQIIKKTFQNYNSEYYNLFIVYFGDINFHLVRKNQYQIQQVKIYGKKIKLRIFTFFVSKQALLQKFRSMNKINTLDHINDLVIQFYQIKRDKKRQKIKKEKEASVIMNKSKIDQYKQTFNEYSSFLKYVVAGGIGVAALYIGVSKFSSIVN